MPLIQRFVVLMVCWAGLAAASELKLQLRGQIVPLPPRVIVRVAGVGSPVLKHTLCNSRGQFKFKKLPPGSYTVSVLHPYFGAAHRSVEVTESFADEKGRVFVEIPYDARRKDTVAALKRRHTVPAEKLAIRPGAWTAYRKAQRKLRSGDRHGAQQQLLKAVDISPQFAAAWNNLGTLAHREGKYEHAERYFKEALAHDAEFFEALVNLGGTLLPLQRFEEALNYNKSALLIEPRSALANSQAGISLFLMRSDDEALRYLAEAKSIDPAHFTYPQLIMAAIHRRQGRAPEARAELQDFVRLHPDVPVAEHVRGILSWSHNLTGGRDAEVPAEQLVP